MFQHLRVFSEYDSPSRPLITPLIRIDMYYPRHMGHYGSIRWMKQRLAGQIQKLQAAPEGERAIMLWALMAYETYPSKGADPLAVFEKGLVPTAKPMAMLKPFSDEIKKLGIPIDLIFIDNEGGFGYFEIGQRGIRRILRSARARAKLPPEVAAVNPDHLVQSHPGFSQARILWDQWAYKLKYDALKRVVIDSGYFDVRPRRTAPIQRPSSVNFWSLNPTFPIRDYNGWNLWNTSLDGRSSGPSSYVGFYGSGFERSVHHWIWNDFINLLNHTRSCLGRPGSVVHPVLSHPLFCHPWIQEQMVAHMVRNGINWSQNKCAFLYWNAYSPHINDPIMVQTMQRHDLAYPLLRNLPEIPFDVDAVTTADFTTTYEDFLINMDSVIGGG